MRQLTTNERALKRALSACVDTIGGQQEAGELIGVSHVSVHRYCVDAHPDCIPNLFNVLKLDSHGGNHVVRKMAEIAGFELKRLEAEEVTDDVLDLATRLHTESSETITVLLQSVSDLKITPNEAKRILKELRDEDKIRRRIEGVCESIIARADK